MSIDVLVPTPMHSEVVCQVLEAGFHVQVQKPLARDMEGADRMLAAVPAGGTLRVLEDYVFFPPLVKMKELIDNGEIGMPVGAHMKIVATGRGGWDIPESSLRWQFEQALDGRGMMVFDHGWHQFAVATWLFGPDPTGVRVARSHRDRAWYRDGRAVDARMGARERPPRRARHLVRHRHVLPLVALHRRRAGRSHGQSRLRPRQPHQRAGHPRTGRSALPRRRDACVPRPRRPPARRLQRFDRARAGVLPRGSRPTDHERRGRSPRAGRADGSVRVRPRGTAPSTYPPVETLSCWSQREDHVELVGCHGKQARGGEATYPLTELRVAFEQLLRQRRGIVAFTCGPQHAGPTEGDVRI